MSPTVEWGSTLMEQKVYSHYKLNFMSDSSTKYKALCVSEIEKSFLCPYLFIIINLRRILGAFELC